MTNFIKLLTSLNILKHFKENIIGHGVASILNIACLSLTIKAIGNENNGILIIVQSACFLIGDLFNFQTLNSSISYLSEKEISKETRRQYIKTGYILDSSTGFLAFIFSHLFLQQLTSLLSWSDQTATLFSYTLYILLFRNNSTGTAMGLLRISSKFKILSYIKSAHQLFRLTTFAILFLSKKDLTAFLIAEIILESIKEVTIFIFSLCEIKDLGLIKTLKARLEIKTVKPFLKFNLFNNLLLSADLILGNLTNIILGKYIGSESVSIFRIFERIGAITTRITVPLGEVVFPKICSLVQENKRQEASSLVMRIQLLILPTSLIFLTVLALLHNHWFSLFSISSDDYLTICLLYFTFVLFTSSTSLIHSLAIANRLMKESTMITLIVNLIYLLLLVPTLESWNLTGLVAIIMAQATLVVILKVYFLKKQT